MVAALFDGDRATATWSRSAAGPRSWPTIPALAAHPRAAAVLGIAAEAAYHRGDHPRAERLARAGLERATDDAGVVVLPACRWRWPSWPAGRYAEVVEHCLAAAASRAGRGRTSASPRSPAAYAGDLDRARALNEQGRAGARRPTMRAWSAYVAGRDRERAPGDPSSAEAALPAGHRAGPHARARRSSSASRPWGCWRCAPPPAASTTRCAATARSSTTSPAPATGPTCGPPCATSPTCCAGSATTSRRRCSTPRRRPRPGRPRRRPAAAAVARAPARRGGGAPSTTDLHRRRCRGQPGGGPRGRPERHRAQPQQALTTSRRRRADSTNDSSPTHAV